MKNTKSFILEPKRAVEDLGTEQEVISQKGEFYGT
jgi:predicted GH43/DUF377 family glycosyl hydrolase